MDDEAAAPNAAVHHRLASGAHRKGVACLCVRGRPKPGRERGGTSSAIRRQRAGVRRLLQPRSGSRSASALPAMGFQPCKAMSLVDAASCAFIPAPAGSLAPGAEMRGASGHETTVAAAHLQTM
jgi:hypothetical protein